MGKRKYDIERIFEKSPVVTLDSIERIVRSKNYARIIINGLLNKNKIIRLSRSSYSKHKDISLAVLAFKPAYLGLQSAISIHKLWDQETIPIIITTNNVRAGIRQVDKANISIRKIRKKYFFGIKYIQEEEYYLPYSDIEKTLIDMIVFNEKIPDEALKNAKIDRKKLASYIKRYPKNIREQIKDKIRFSML